MSKCLFCDHAAMFSLIGFRNPLNMDHHVSCPYCGQYKLSSKLQKSKEEMNEYERNNLYRVSAYIKNENAHGKIPYLVYETPREIANEICISVWVIIYGYHEETVYPDCI